MEWVRFVAVDEVQRLILELPPEERDKMLAEVFKALPPESRSRVMGLSDSGLTVITGSFVSLNSDIAVNIQNSNSSFDPQALIKALLDYRHSQQKD